MGMTAPGTTGPQRARAGARFGAPEPSPQRPRRIEARPAAAMLCAPVVGFGLWAAVLSAVFG